MMEQTRNPKQNLSPHHKSDIRHTDRISPPPKPVAPLVEEAVYQNRNIY
jgi:hypothetical protein